MKLNRTAHRVTEILRLLAESPEGLTLTEIGNELALPKASAFDIVQTLKKTHFLRESNRRYAIGFMAQEVGEAYSKGKDLYGATQPHLAVLADALNMAGSLVTYERGTLNYVIEHRPIGSIVNPVASSGMDFVHASSSGKSLIAFMPEARQRKALSLLTFKRFTDRTILNMVDFMEELERIRTRGYAIDNREFNELMTCVSTPIFRRNQAVATLTLSDLQVDPDAVPDIAERLLETARNIAAELAKDDE
ncbi:MAG: IclR family transcriptional regulator [Desulfovibrio sp.]|uniref:IclR family transcriptional regulator n=1 Tax=Desulfovibrio sp. 7SRBS1 TaxID=3378064 RepID=UPI003B40E1CF